MFASARRCSSRATSNPPTSGCSDGLGLGEPFRDPAVALFGLHNVVCALGEDFIEIVSPTEEGTAAGRHLDRRGEGGYMVIFQLDDLRARASARRSSACAPCGSIDIDDISATHLHPADIGGAIVSIDRPMPPESWRWGGPDWIGARRRGRARAARRGNAFAFPTPRRLAARWGEVLGLEPDGTTLRLDRDQHVTFEQGDEGLAEIAVELPGGAAEPLAFGVRADRSRLMTSPMQTSCKTRRGLLVLVLLSALILASPASAAVTFEKVSLASATGRPFTSVVVGPDGKLYAGRLRARSCGFR